MAQNQSERLALRQAEIDKLLQQHQKVVDDALSRLRNRLMDEVCQFQVLVSAKNATEEELDMDFSLVENYLINKLK